jgi:phosphatidate cytidylyltransferase
MLKQRIITAVILVPLFLAFLFYTTPRGFYFISALIALGGAWEWTNLMGIHTLLGRFAYLTLMILIFVWASFISLNTIFIIAFIWWIIAIVFIFMYPRASRWWGNGLYLRGLMGVFVLMPCWAALNYIRNENEGIYLLLFLFVLIWGADSIAYFVGKKWGKTKLIPLVSPGKSIQGMWGALISSIVIASLILWWNQIPYPKWLYVIALSLATVVFSIVGDLFESMMKRQVGIKDSGKLLPGHGGLLDRIDSLTAAAPIFALGITVLLARI